VGETQNLPFQLSFNRSLKVDFQGSRVTSDGGLLLVRELHEHLGLNELIEEHMTDDQDRIRHGGDSSYGKDADRKSDGPRLLYLRLWNGMMWVNMLPTMAGRKRVPAGDRGPHTAGGPRLPALATPMPAPRREFIHRGGVFRVGQRGA
jgi:hypothetical protein